MKERLGGEPILASEWSVGEVLRDGVGRMRVKASPHQWKVLRAVQACRTGALGVATYRCRDCGRLHPVPLRCGNRHCPECQGHMALAWLKKQESRLLEAPYFHLVLTLPHALHGLIRQNRQKLYEVLMETASQTLLSFGRNHLDAEIGLTMVLHTWGQCLQEHYHVHAIVTGGGLDAQGRWRQVRAAYYLFPIRALSAVFEGKFCDELWRLRRAGELEYHGEQASLRQDQAFALLMRLARKRRWVVYAKKPFAGPETVLRYLSNYTHRVGMSSRRIEHLDRETHQVRFRYRDYALGGMVRRMQMDTGEFARRFCLHILPQGFCKVRHYGLLGNRGRERRLAKARAAIEAAAATTTKTPEKAPSLQGEAVEPEAATTTTKRCCPFCGSERIRLWRVDCVPTEWEPGSDSS
jgi:Putative transposase/Transposase zinc-binding domain